MVGAIVDKCFLRLQVLIEMGRRHQYVIDRVMAFGCWGLELCRGVTNPLGGKNVCANGAVIKQQRRTAVGSE